jgi:hypothetical protein
MLEGTIADMAKNADVAMMVDMTMQCDVVDVH